MPLNERVPQRTNMTREQKRDVLAAIYGVPPAMTDFEIDQLRARLAAADDTPTQQEI